MPRVVEHPPGTTNYDCEMELVVEVGVAGFRSIRP